MYNGKEEGTLKNKLSDALQKNIKENVWAYFSVTLFFAIGLAAGAFTVKALDNNQKQELIVYLKGFFQTISGEKINNGKVLFQAIRNNFQTVFLMWLLGITVIGIPVTLFITSFRGFIVGFTISFLVQGLGWKGVLFMIAAVLPQNVLYIPCLLVISAISVCFSLQVFKRKVKRGIVDIKGSIISYTTTVAIAFLIMCAGCIIESYISPYLLQAMSNYMIVQ